MCIYQLSKLKLGNYLPTYFSKMSQFGWKKGRMVSLISEIDIILKLFCHFPGILLPYLWIQISPEMCRWSAQVMPAGQDPKSSCSGVSLFFDFLICVNCVSFCYFFLKGWSSAMKHRDSHDPSYFTLMSLYERFTKERYL